VVSGWGSCNGIMQVANVSQYKLTCRGKELWI